jgi:uncharacterized DUF497 family protein
VHTIFPVAYEWDEEKAAANLRKHGVDFADAARVLEDELALTMLDLISEEERSLPSDAIPMGGCSWWSTPGGERIRLISARETTSKERRHYEKGT